MTEVTQPNNGFIINVLIGCRCLLQLVECGTKCRCYVPRMLINLHEHNGRNNGVDGRPSEEMFMGCGCFQTIVIDNVRIVRTD